MLTGLQLTNFKSWDDTGPIRLAPLTILFGRNSSGKSSLLQSLLLMKQTAESLDPRQVLNLGSTDAYVDLGTYQDVVRDHNADSRIGFSFSWHLQEQVALRQVGSNQLRSDRFGFDVEVGQEGTGQIREISVHKMTYAIDPGSGRLVGMVRNGRGEYELTSTRMSLTRRRGRPQSLPEPIRCYAFPDAVFNAYQNADFLSDLSLQFDELMSGVSYVGPLRERPQRSYQWRGNSPSSVGPRGENTVAAILAARRQGRRMGRESTPGRPYRSFEGNLGYWLKQMGVIDEFAVEEIASGTDLYELRVTVCGGSTRVSVTDVGFGVSQVLPVLVQVFYAAPGTSVVLEQPEIHLHPAAQSALGDVLLAAVRDNKSQLLVETHSEHLLHRVQRRIAEEEIAANDVALYFVETQGGRSEIHELKVDDYGNIINWPQDFFGDEIGDLAAMAEAAAERRMRRG
jgi:predicted ATPase